MNSYYENQGHITYLTFEVEDSEALDTMSLGMITNNKIPGLAPCVFTQMDSTKYLKYNVSSKLSLQQFFSGAIKKSTLISVFEGIADAVIDAEDYMIDARSFVFDTNYVFIDVSSTDVVMVCLPLMSTVTDESVIHSFFKNIMFTTQFDQSENCGYVAKLINYLNSVQRFSIGDFKNFLQTIKDGNYSANNQ